MDVLHFFKSHHDDIRDGLTRLAAADGTKARRAVLDDLARDLQVHLDLEKDYLYPEVAGLFPGAEAVVTTGLANGVVISKHLKLLTKMATKPAAEQEGFDKRLSELRDAVVAHFEQEEQVLMPKIRSMIRTEDREDLGQVFVDVKAEVLAAMAPVDPTKSPSPSRKRA